MNKKQYYLIKYNQSPLYVYITYKTDYSSGKMEFKGLFFIEMYKRITKLLKRVQIGVIIIKNEELGITLHYCGSLERCYDKLMEMHTRKEEKHE